MNAYIIVAGKKDCWPAVCGFQPSHVPKTARIVKFSPRRHRRMAKRFICFRYDGHLCVVFDGLGIATHQVLAQTYWYLVHGRKFNKQKFQRWERTITSGGCFPILPIMVKSGSYPGELPLSARLRVLRLIYPDGRIKLDIEAVHTESAASPR